jgi:hypothetical protein
MVVMSSGSAVLANIAEGPAAWGAAIFSAALLILYVFIEIFRPWQQRRKRKRPCVAHFTIRNSKRSLSGRDVSQGDPHFVKRLTLPAHQESSVEIGLLPRINFHLVEFVFGCKGDRTKRPYAIERIFQFIAQGNSHRREEAKQRDFKDTNGYFHAWFDRPRNKGTHFVIGLTLRAQEPGLYPVEISFITDDVEGNFYGLEILVEDQPKTKMHCHKRPHGLNCLVSPFDLPFSAWPSSRSVAGPAPYRP